MAVYAKFISEIGFIQVLVFRIDARAGKTYSRLISESADSTASKKPAGARPWIKAGCARRDALKLRLIYLNYEYQATVNLQAMWKRC